MKDFLKTVLYAAKLYLYAGIILGIVMLIIIAVFVLPLFL